MCTIFIALTILLPILILLRIIYLIFLVNGKISCKRMNNCPAKTLIVLGSGGHTTEMLKIVSHLSKKNYMPRIYVRAHNDNISFEKVKQFEDENKNYKIMSINRSREVYQSYLSSVWSTLYASMNSVSIIWAEAPDLLLCNGPGTCVPLCIIAFFLKIVFLLDTKIIFVESFCRVKSFSLSGKILYYLVDHVIVQWPYLRKPLYNRSIFVQ